MKYFELLDWRKKLDDSDTDVSYRLLLLEQHIKQHKENVMDLSKRFPGVFPKGPWKRKPCATRLPEYKEYLKCGACAVAYRGLKINGGFKFRFCHSLSE